MKVVVGIVVLALGVYWGARQGYIKSQWVGRIFGLGASASQSEIEQIVANTNRRLPRMVTDDISFDRVTHNKTEVVFHYRFVELDQLAAMQKFGAYLPDLQEALVKDLCASQEIRDEVFRRGYNAQVMLRSNDARTLLSPYVRAPGCG